MYTLSFLNTIIYYIYIYIFCGYGGCQKISGYHGAIYMLNFTELYSSVIYS